MNKFILLAASAALVLGACSKNEVTSIDDEAIGFGTYAPTSVTKADGSYTGTTTLKSGEKFVIYGYNQGVGNFATTLKPSFMNNVAVTYGSNGNVFASMNSYSPLRYWPKDEENNKLAFYAYYPQSGNVVPTVNAEDAGLGSYAFTVNSDITKQSDFMIAGLETDETYSKKAGTVKTNPGVVALTFKHQLTKVRFAVKTDADYAETVIKVTSIKLSGVKTSGTLTPSYASATTTTAWSAVAAASSAVTFTVPDVAVTLTTTLQPAAEAAGDVYLMIPQTLGDDVKVEVVYTVQTDSDAIVTNTQSFNINTVQDAANAAITSWGMNKSIVYNIVIGLHPIIFTGTVSDWEDVTTGSITIK